MHPYPLAVCKQILRTMKGKNMASAGDFGIFFRKQHFRTVCLINKGANGESQDGKLVGKPTAYFSACACVPINDTPAAFASITPAGFAPYIQQIIGFADRFCHLKLSNCHATRAVNVKIITVAHLPARQFQQAVYIITAWSSGVCGIKRL